MNRMLFVATLLLSQGVHAQWGGFLDPNIIRQAGEAAATGNINLNNTNIDDGSTEYWRREYELMQREQQVREVERQATAAQQKAKADSLAQHNKVEVIQSHIRYRYEAEFGR